MDTMSRCRETWRGVDRHRGVDSSRGAEPSLCNVLSVLTVNFFFSIVQKLQAIKYKKMTIEEMSIRIICGKTATVP